MKFLILLALAAMAQAQYAQYAYNPYAYAPVAAAPIPLAAPVVAAPVPIAAPVPVAAPVYTDYRYLGPQAIPSVLPDGHLDDTPAVKAAKLEHYSAHVRALSY